MVIGLGFGIPIIAVGLYPLALGVVGFIGSQGDNHHSYWDVFLFLGGVWVVGGLILVAIDLGLLWGLNGQSVIAWLMTLGLLGLGLWLDLPSVWGKPWWVGLGVQWFLSAGGPPYDLNYWWHWVAIATSADVHVVLVACMVVLLMWPSTVAWLFGRDARVGQSPWKLKPGR